MYYYLITHARGQQLKKKKKPKQSNKAVTSEVLVNFSGIFPGRPLFLGPKSSVCPTNGLLLNSFFHNLFDVEEVFLKTSSIFDQRP